LKVTEKKAIKDGEEELIDTVTGDLDWDNIEKILKDKHNFELQDDIEYKRGDIIVYENQIAYKIDFDVKVSVSVLFDRNGDCLDVDTEGDADAIKKGAENSLD